MVQILPARQSFGAQFGRGVGASFGQGFSEGMEQNKSRAALKSENESIKKAYGIDLSGVNDPKARQAILAESLKGKRQTEKFDRLSNIIS